jgi:glucose/arabinose dehydrogenase
MRKRSFGNTPFFFIIKNFCAVLVILLLFQWHLSTPYDLTSPVHAAPPNFINQTLIIGLNEPTAIEFLPDGSMLILERYGTIRIVEPGEITTNPTPFLQLTNINTEQGERGLTGIALDPNYETNGYFYLFYTSASPLRDRVSRFTATGLTANPGSEVIIWQDNVAAGEWHHGGSVIVGNDNNLYISVGDHFENPNDAQNLTSYHGKLLRLGRNGEVPTNNPFYDGTGPNLDEIYALGLRNPFRISIDRLTGNIYIGDVGSNSGVSIEELNLAAPGANYGWPICEGPTCNNPPTLGSYTPPFYSYSHNGRDASITAGFVYRGSQFPPEYQGSFFYGDYTQNWIRRLVLDDGGSVSGDFSFEPEDGSQDGPYGEIVDFEEGPDGALYYVDIGISWEGNSNLGTVRRIRYIAANQPPIITQAEANPTSGPGPTLNVSFSASATDPENNPLTYIWDFGDGNGSNDPNPTHTYQSGGYTARLTVSDGTNNTLSNPIFITVGNLPIAIIDTPITNSLFRAGDTILYSGSAVDPDETLAPEAFSWRILFHHLSHVHPAGGPFDGVTSGTLDIPISSHEITNETYYEIILTITDSTGLQDSTSVSIYPETVELSFDTVPAGLPLSLDDIPRVTPFTYNSVIGFSHAIDAPLQQSLAGVTYDFVSWSDGESAAHGITVPDTNQSYIATYEVAAGPTNYYYYLVLILK